MKRIIVMILALALALSLCACGGENVSGETTEATEGYDASKDDFGGALAVGFGRVNITPSYEVALDGSAYEPETKEYLDPIYITCVAIRENKQTYLVYTMDLITAEDWFVDPAKDSASAATGIPVSNILMNGTHTHSSAAIRNGKMINVEIYRRDFYKWTAEAAKLALKDLSLATVSCGSSETEGLTFVRHYEIADGTYAGANFGSYAAGIVGHASEADTELQVVRFARAAEDKKDVVLMSFPSHATMTSGQKLISADFPGVARDFVESNTDALVAYFIAAGGNQVPSSRIESENYVHDADYKRHGQALGQYVLEIMKDMTPVAGDDVTLNVEVYYAPSNKENVDRLEDAQEVAARWEEVGRGSSQARQYALEAGFTSVYEVSEIIKRANYSDNMDMVLKIMSIGDIGFVFAPYEMFSDQGVYIKEKSPYDFTFIVTCGEGSEGYMPSKFGWQIGTYESCVSHYARGVAEAVAEKFVEMLTTLHGGE